MLYQKEDINSRWAVVNDYFFKEKCLMINKKKYYAFLKIQQDEQQWLICEHTIGHIQPCGDFFIRYPVCLYTSTKQDVQRIEELFHLVDNVPIRQSETTSCDDTLDIDITYNSDSDNSEISKAPSSLSLAQSEDDHESSESLDDVDALSDISSAVDISDTSVS